MRILVHDYSGHPFQAQLSRELARRGHQVTHSYCEAYQSGKGALSASGDESVVFDAIGRGELIRKLRFGPRLVQELRYGGQLVRQARRVRPDVVLASNVPVPTLMVFALYAWVARLPWVLWHQDIQFIAIRSFAGKQLSRAFSLVSRLIGVGEKWCARRAAAVVVISEAFVDVHRDWGTAGRTHVVPNWAPLDEIYPVERRNAWSAEHGLDQVPTLLYSGTLGLKHNPALLVKLARRVVDRGVPVRLVVVTEGQAEPVLRDEATALGVELELLPFQPYARLPEVLGSGDVLVVLLEQEAGAFSVPSKTLSYLSAGRPVLGLIPAENLAAKLVVQVDGCVLAPAEASLDAAADWVVTVLKDEERAGLLGKQARQLAEQQFALETCADKFEEILARCVK